MNLKRFALAPLLLALALSCGGDDPKPAPTIPPNEWVTRAPMPTARSEVASAVLNGKIYVIGGLTDDYTPLATVEVYDPSRDTWKPGRPLPRPRHHAAAATVNGHLFVIGGFEDADFTQPAARILEYTPDRWIERSSMPTPRAAMAVAVLDGEIWAMGGTTGRRNEDTVATVEVYDPVNDAWRDEQSLRNARDHAAGAAYGREVYALGGRAGVAFGEPVTGFEGIPLDAPGMVIEGEGGSPLLSGLGVASVGDCFFAVGGGTESEVVATVQKLCPDGAMGVPATPIPTARHSMATAAVDGVIYVIGGSTSPVLTPTSVNEAYRPVE